MTEAQPPKTLQALMDSSANFVDRLYGNRKGSVVRDSVLRQPTQFVAPEFTNWRDEQRAWRQTVALYDQSFHMTTTYVRGADALPFFAAMGINGFTTFGPGRARHFVSCSPSGHVIGDGVLYCLGPEEVALVGRAAGHNWIQFQAETGGWDVALERDEIFSRNPAGRRTVYRYQVEGPNAFALLEHLIGAPLPETRAFQILPLTIAGHRVSALRHTMAGGPGYELFGAWDEGPDVKAAIIAAGPAFGLRQVGSMAYFTTAVELGWIPRPLPAIYTDDNLRSFREWLPATCEEATWSLGGSFCSSAIADYYFTPWELGYRHLVKFNHDFVGREALERSAAERHRHKVTLVWDAEDVARAFASYADTQELPAKYIDLPRANYATWQYDTVLDEGGRAAGVSTYACMSWNERALLSLAVLEPELAEPGTRVTVVWGEPDGGAKSAPWLEPHRQVEIRATVAKSNDQ
jgi:vanillate/3-O-methylgallate O-demethylase